MKTYTVWQQTEPGKRRLVECDEYGVITVHRTKMAANSVCKSKLPPGCKQSPVTYGGYYVAESDFNSKAILNVVR